MKRTRSGFIYGVSAYAVWGAFPFYFDLLERIGPFEVVVWRVLSTFIFSIFLVTTVKRWGLVREIMADRRKFGWFALSSILLFSNWQIFVYGVMSGQIIETSLGYFINPLVTILLGVFLRKEKLSRLQWTAVGIAAVGVLAVAIGYGKFPWISITLALTFGLYGAVHKHVGAGIDGITGLAVESFVALPIALVQGYLVWKILDFHVLDHGTGFVVLMAISGLVTAVPLIFFGEATRRLPLSYVGFLQFMTPILSFLYGYYIAGEEMSGTRWLGFALVWLALIVLVTDMVIRLRNSPGGASFKPE